MSASENEMLARVSVEQVLARLNEADRVMLNMIYEIEFPEDWGNLPVTYTNIGAYIGKRFEGKALSEAAIRYRRDVLIRVLRGERGELRRPRRKPAKQKPR